MVSAMPAGRLPIFTGLGAEQALYGPSPAATLIIEGPPVTAQEPVCEDDEEADDMEDEVDDMDEDEDEDEDSCEDEDEAEDDEAEDEVADPGNGTVPGQGI